MPAVPVILNNTPLVAEAIDELLAAGLHLDNNLIAEVLRMAEEAD